MQKTYLSWLQSDDVGPGSLKCREPPQVWMENIHLAEDTGLLIGDPGWVEVNGVLGRKKVPPLPAHKNITDMNSDRAGKDCC